MGNICCRACINPNKVQSINSDVPINRENIAMAMTAANHNGTSSGTHISTIQSALGNQPLTSISESKEIEKEEEFIEKAVCHESDLDENGMNEVDFGSDQKVLLIKQNGKFYATGANCAHYGAPLVMGTLGDGRIRCPWHGACFNIKTGDIEDFPSLDSIPCYQVKIDETGQVKIRAKQSLLQKEKVMKSMSQRDVKNSATFVIIGGGPSALTCAETLRQNGFTGRIVMICKEPYLPYDRSQVSKSLINNIEDVELRPQHFYDKNNIETLLSVEAIDLNSVAKIIKLSNGSSMKYDKVYVATGTRARKLKIPGINLKNILTLRTLNDAFELNSKINSKSQVVILGSSFIALEVAAYCVDKVAKVTIIGRRSVPLIEAFGEQIGNFIMELLKKKNIKFIMENEIKGFFGINQEQYLSAIKLSSGEFLRADVCILAVGSKFNTKFLRNSGVTINKNGSIDSNSFMETNISDIYVGGDIANFPIHFNDDERATICHYHIAQHHGRIAALNMIGISTKIKILPYFFTYLFDNYFTYVGYKKPTSIYVHGNLDELKFSAFYLDSEDNVVGVCTCQPNKITSDYAEKIMQGHKITRADLSKHFGIKIESTQPFVKDTALSDDFIEESVCDILDVAENEMKEFVIDGDKKILLVKQEGKIHALGANCAHYGAPLVMGSLGEGRVRCPWHGACFNIETGDIEDFPGLDSIPCHQVKIDERNVIVRARKSLLQKQKIVKPMAQRDTKNGQMFLILGGGPSAQTCAETLRQNGYMGRIIMICKESYFPYDRIKVSKFMDSKIEDIQLRSASFYDENSIEVMLNIEATDVNSNLKEITLSCGSKLKYDKLYIATGCRSKMLNIPGSHLNNIFTLRSLTDANNINLKINSKSHVVIVGSSFIALEAATYCVGKVAKVTVIGRSSVPLIESFGEIIGNRIMSLFESKQVEFIMESEVKSFLGNYKDLERVELNDGKCIWADVCIVAIGSHFNTEFLVNSGIKMNHNGCIDTNEYLETNIRDIYVGGDIANSPIFTHSNKRASIGHYGVAQYHGKIAALNMIGMKTELRTVPYFFTLLFDYCFTFTGYGRDVAEIFVDGDLEEFKFAAFYFDEEQNVVGMSSCQYDKGISDFAEKLAQGFCYHRDDIEWAIELEEEEEGIEHHI